MGFTASWRRIEELQARGEFPFAEILNVREDDLSGLELEIQGTGTLSFSFSTQLKMDTVAT